MSEARPLRVGDRVRYRIPVLHGPTSVGTGKIIHQGRLFPWVVLSDDPAIVDPLLAMPEELELIDDTGITRFAVLFWTVYLAGLAWVAYRWPWWTLAGLAVCLTPLVVLTAVEARRPASEWEEEE